MNLDGKKRILEAAFKLFSDKGFDAVGIREIATEAGLSNPALYQHFNSKEALGEALYLSCYQNQMDTLDRRLKPEMSVLEKFDAYIDSAVHLHKRTPSSLLFLEKMQGHFGLAAREAYGKDAITQRFKKWLAEGQQSGIVRTDVPVPMLIGLVIGQVTMWALLSNHDLAPTRSAATSMKRLMRSAITPPNDSF